MEVILLKDVKNVGKANEVVKVSDGYAKNFLIHNQLALPINAKTKDNLQKTLANQQTAAALIKNQSEMIKVKLESLVINFELKHTNGVVHGSISKKQVFKKLLEYEVKLDHYALPHLHIASLGQTIVPINLPGDVLAKLKIEVKPNGQ